MALKEQQKRNDFLWMVLGIILVTAVGYFYTYPQIIAWQNALIAAEARRLDAQEAQNKVSTVEQKKAEIAQNQDIVNELNLVAPGNQAEDDFVATLESIAENTGLTVNFFQPNFNSEHLEVSINANGSFLGIGLFLQDIQKNLRPVKISELRITNVSSVPGASLLNATMKITAATAVALEEQPTGDQGGTNGQ